MPCSSELSIKPDLNLARLASSSKRMPLLGRHKSSSSSSSPSASGGFNSSPKQHQQHQTSNNTATSSTAHGRPQQPLCESPLFGMRRQLPLGDVSGSGSGSGATGGRQAAAAAATSAGGAAATSDSLSSVPQQITRQQINYAFSIMDTNKDGMIDLRDLSQMLANLGVPIDEAILSHIMSSVSKRGDHRISEAEFLDWISRFIQISDSPTTVGGGGGRGRPKDQQPVALSGRRRLQGLTGAAGSGGGGGPNSLASVAGKSSRVARSSTAGYSLAAAQPSPDQVAALRNRRGSGSGLALMRSLSSSSTDRKAESGGETLAGQQQRGRLPSSGSGGDLDLAAAAAAATSQAAADLEARNDLKAAFGVFDLDGDGFITIDEVRAGLKLLGESWSPSELQNLFNRCSGSGPDGQHSGKRISIEDFVHLLL